MADQPEISFVLATFNRHDITLATLRQLTGSASPLLPYEILVVDNASTDGTCQAIRTHFPEVRLIESPHNWGSCGKALGVDAAQGRFIVFLDDDSYPRPGTIDRMVERFQSDPGLGAASFRAHLPDGGQECSAFPNVFIGCGVGFRAEALRAVGGLDSTFFMQAEEYDLSFRLVNAGWRVETFDDLHVEHLKTPQARRSGRTVYYDTRNNLIVAARYLPGRHYRDYRQDWCQRYAWMAKRDRKIKPFLRGYLAGTAKGMVDRRLGRHRQLTPAAFEALFRHEFIAERMARLASTGVRRNEYGTGLRPVRIVFLSLGKNMLAFQRAADESDISVLVIGDDAFAAPNRHYRGTPIVPVAQALAMQPDAVVISNTSPVHASLARKAARQLTAAPIHCWFSSDEIAERPKIIPNSRRIVSDKTPLPEPAAVN